MARLEADAQAPSPTAQGAHNEHTRAPHPEPTGASGMSQVKQVKQVTLTITGIWLPILIVVSIAALWLIGDTRSRIAALEQRIERLEAAR